MNISVSNDQGLNIYNDDNVEDRNNNDMIDDVENYLDMVNDDHDDGNNDLFNDDDDDDHDDRIIDNELMNDVDEGQDSVIKQVSKKLKSDIKKPKTKWVIYSSEVG